MFRLKLLWMLFSRVLIFVAATGGQPFHPWAFLRPVLSWLTPPSELRLECAISLSPKISVAILAFISVVVRVNKGLTVGFGCDAEFWFGFGVNDVYRNVY